MQLSDRITGINRSGRDGWALFRRARALQAQGVALTDLTIGEHDTPTDRGILDALHAAAVGGATGYPPVPGLPALRAEVAARIEARSGVATGPENVLIVPGGQAGLFAAHVAVADPGAAALYVDPHYATYPGTIRAAGLEPFALPAPADRGFHPQAADFDAAAARHGARSLLLNTPNNPTGAVYSRATLEGLAEVARARDIWLISDEVYDTQVWDGAHLSPRALPGMADRVLVLGSMSKSHAMTGSRIGWMVGPPAAIAALEDLATNTTYGVPGYIQHAALHALRQGTALEQAIAAPFARRRAIAQRVLAGHDVLRLLPPQGAMYLFLDVRATRMTGEGFAAALLEEARIALMPGESFGAAAAGHVRIAMTAGDEAFEAALHRIAAFARARAQAA